MNEKKYGKHTILLDGEVLISRTCGVCWSMKERDNFFAAKTRYGISSTCKECDKAKTKEFLRGNKKHQERTSKWRQDNANKHRGYVSAWQKRNPVAVSIKGAKRRARKENLPDTFALEDANTLTERFGGCFLTGDSVFQFDHVIPIAKGCGGTIMGNMIPLRNDLNQSKGARNIFEWFASVKEREQLSQERFDEGIAYLAELNGMTPEEYRIHVYECYK